MARSFTYDRPLDAKILPNTDNELRFPTLLEIKKEVENDTSDMETEVSAKLPVSNSNCIDDDHQRQPQSANLLYRRREESNKSSHPKLVIKFRDLWKNSGQNGNFCRKRKKSEYKELHTEVPKACELRSDKRRRSELSISSEERFTRSSSTAPKPSADKEKKTEESYSEKKTVTFKGKEQDAWNFGRLTRLNRNLNSVCENCGMCFAKKKYLLSHKRYYTPNEDLHCTICDIGFSRDSQLARHNKRAHSAVENKNTYKYKCHLCTDRFERKAYLIAHVAHLHIKHVVSHKRNRNSDRKNPPLDDMRCKGKKKEESTRRSKRNVKPTIRRNSIDYEIKLAAESDSVTDLKSSTGDLCNRNRYLTHESSSAQVCDEYPILDKSEPNKATSRKVLQSPINDVIEKSIESTDLPEIVREDASPCSTPISEKSEVLRRSQENSEDKKQLHASQVSFETASQNVQPQLSGDLVDHFGNTVGTRCVSEPVNQPNKTDDISGCNSDSITIDPADVWSTEGMANRIWSTRSSSFKTNTIESSTVSYCASLTRLDETLPANRNLSTRGKNPNYLHHNYTSSKINPNQGGEIQKLLAQHHQFDPQVGLVLSHQVSDDKTLTENFPAGISSVKCDAGFDFIHVDDIGGIPKSTTLPCKDENMSDESCESVSLKMEASPLNGSSTDLTNLYSYNATTLKDYNTLNNKKIKDVRVLVVKLENMLDLSTKNNPPKSSALETCSLLETQIADNHPCEEISANDLGLSPRSNRKRNCKKVKYNHESRSGTQKNYVNSSPKIPSDHSTLGQHDKLKEGLRKSTEKRCYFCDEVFRNNFSATSHYLSFHTKIGDFRCCLCHEIFKNLRSLRNHLYRNHNACAKKRLLKCCAVCKKELSNPSLSQRCSECGGYPKSINSDSRGEQFLDTQDLTENNLAYNLLTRELEVRENISMSPLMKPPASMLTEMVENHIVIPVIKRESANYVTKCSSRTCKEGLKHSKCLARNCVSFQSRQSPKPLAISETGVKCCSYEMCHNVVQPQIPLDLKSQNCIKKSETHCETENSIPKSGVGKKKKLKYNKIKNHDKSCKKQLSMRRKLKLSYRNSSQRSIRHLRNRRHTKTCYDYKCDICGLNCCCRRNLKIHKTRYSTTGNNVCNICGLTFARKHMLVMHMKTAHNPKVFLRSRVRCEICNQGFYNKMFLRIHLSHFHKIKYFQCKVCRIRFDTCRSLNNHTRYYSKNVNYPCSICDRTFKCKYILDYHTAQAHNRDKLKVYKYSCDTCSFAFVDELFLQAHIGHFHNTQDSEVETAIDQNVRKSPEQSAKDIEHSVKTKKVFIHSKIKTENSSTPINADKNHNSQDITEDVADKTVRIHTSSEYKCNICKLSFTDPYAILNHEWEFSNEGTYACDVCHRKFMTDSLLRNHKIKHYEGNVVRSYECYVCKEDFSIVDNLKMHGLHLHGPQFVLHKCFETTDKNNSIWLDSQTECARDVISKNLPLDRTYNTLGLMASNKFPHNGRILLFQKVIKNRSSIELLRRHSNGDAYFCDFCETNFSSASLLKYHSRKHAYHAYYSNSSRYLCLICKNKFRTNDILRAHVMHCHTSNTEKKKPHLSEIGRSESEADSHVEQIGASTCIEPVNVAKPLPFIHAIQNHPSTLEKGNCIPTLKSASPGKKKQASNTTSNGGILRSDHSHLISLPREIESDIVRDAGCEYSSKWGRFKSMESNNSGITSHLESGALPDEVKFFTIEVEDMNGSQRNACSICIDVFHTVAHFRKHFATDHVEDGAFLCTLCGKKFSVMSDLKHHAVKHRPKNFVCCGMKFKQVVDFIRHQFLHNKQINGKQNDLNISPVDNTGFLNDYDKKSDDSRSENSWKCEICDAVFLDFEMMLKHWDVCIDTNGLQCDMCIAMFKNPNSLQVHKMTYHNKDKQQNRNVVHNRSRFRGNSNRTSQSATQTRIVHDNKPGNKKTAASSINTHATQQIERVFTPTDKSLKQNELLKYVPIAVKPSAKIYDNSKNEIEGCGSEQNAENNTVSTTKLHTEFTARKSVGIATKRDSLKIPHKNISIKQVGKTICLEMKRDASNQTNLQVSKSNELVSKRISYNANRNNLYNYFPIRDSTNVGKTDSVSNDLSIRMKQNECKEQRLSTLKRNSTITAENLSSIRSIAHTFNNIDKGREALSEFDGKSLPNNYKDKGSLKLPPVSSNATSSQTSSNTASNLVYYFRIPASIDNPDTSDDVTIIPSNSRQKPDYSDCSEKILSDLVPLPLNPSISSRFVVSDPSAAQKSDQSNNQTIVSNPPDHESNLNNRTRNRLPLLLSNSSSVVIKPVYIFDKNRVTNKVQGSSHENDSGLRSPSHYERNVMVPVLPATSGSSTHNVRPTTHENSVKDNRSPSRSASENESTHLNHSVRCNYCNLSFTEETKLVEHVNSHKANNQCPACGLTFSNGRALEQHLPEHRCSTCTKCQMVFFFNDTVAYLTGAQKYCSVCDSLLPSPTRNHNRATINSGHQIMKCGICMNAFGTISEMTVHFKQVHSTFVCGVCESKFSTKTTLQNHMQTHANASLKTSQCKTCNKYFSGKLELVYHELSH